MSRRLRLAAASTARPGCASARGWALTKLVGQACLPQVWREVLCQGPANESDVADNQGTNAAIGFAQRNHAPKAPSLEDLLWHVCVSQALGSSAEQCAVRRVI